VRQDLEICNRKSTPDWSIKHITAFARFFGRSPDQLGPEQVRLWQLRLIEERGLSSSTLKVALWARRFFYRITLRRSEAIERVPTVPAVEFIARFLRHVLPKGFVRCDTSDSGPTPGGPRAGNLPGAA